MAVSLNYFWKAGTPDCVAKVQEWEENVNLKINGDWSVKTPNSVNFNAMGMVRPVFIMAGGEGDIPDDGLIFEIVGSQNGVKIVGHAVITEAETETWFYIVDPANYDPTDTINCYFDNIISITPQSPAVDGLGVVVGTGRINDINLGIEGFIPLIPIDIHDTFQSISWSVQMGIYSSGIGVGDPKVQMTILGTSFPLNFARDYLQLIDTSKFFIAFTPDEPSTTINYYSNILCKNILISVATISRDYDELQLSFLQL